MVYGSMVGLGFALVANVYAYAVAWNSGAGALAEEFARRGIFGPVFQALFTSLIGLGVAYAAARPGAHQQVPGDRRRLGRGGRARRAVESLRRRGRHRAPVTYVILIAVLLAVIIVVVVDRRRVVRLITSFLPDFEHPEVVTVAGHPHARQPADAPPRQALGAG